MFSRDTKQKFTFYRDAIIRGDSTRKEIALVFTGGDFSDGGQHIQKVLKQENIPAGFFFTGDFYRDEHNKTLIDNLIHDGHYLGPHSDQHLLYCSWEKRDSLLVTKNKFIRDMLANYSEMERFGIHQNDAPFFIPPYEWYNETIVQWADETGLVLFNITPGTLSHADYTTPDMSNYRDSEKIYRSILDYENKHENGLNGFILLIHIGSHPDRTDKFYLKLKPLIVELSNRGYNFIRIDQLIGK
ncbi:MAG: polysaccharide deacetylase family protein [Candidatus Marinimicrobia bacterium]|nr:polysaccharide deacetylase family protein [Candidatus Neomarinimicrobiota bacterium]